MRTEQVKVYKFHELPEEVQEQVISNEAPYMEFGWHSEYQDSLKAFCDCLGIAEPSWQHERGQVFHYDEDREHWHEAMRGRRLSEFDRESMPTGFCADSDLFYAFVDTWKETGSAVDGINEAFAAFFRAWQSDMDYQFSEEGIREHIECNEYEFTENGEFWG